jgi:hypothetical protein
MRLSELKPEFVDFVPPDLEEGVLYVSMNYGTAIHLCACGCGEKAVTPLTPTDWKLIFDGETVSLWPSVGNWSFDCRSHYVVKKNKIRWAEDWSRSKVRANRDRQHGEKQRYFEKQSESSQRPMDEEVGLLRRLRERFHLF